MTFTPDQIATFWRVESVLVHVCALCFFMLVIGLVIHDAHAQRLKERQERAQARRLREHEAKEARGVVVSDPEGRKDGGHGFYTPQRSFSDPAAKGINNGQKKPINPLLARHREER